MHQRISENKISSFNPLGVQYQKSGKNFLASFISNVFKKGKASLSQVGSNVYRADIEEWLKTGFAPFQPLRVRI